MPVSTTTRLRIGELADRAGVSVRSLRYYEEQGLLPAERSPGGHRSYPPQAVDRVVLVQALYAAGLTSATIREVLPCMRDSDGGPGVSATPWLVERLREERDRLDSRMLELRRTREVLDEVIDTAAGG